MKQLLLLGGLLLMVLLIPIMSAPNLVNEDLPKLEAPTVVTTVASITDTNATTECALGEWLSGEGDCHPFNVTVDLRIGVIGGDNASWNQTKANELYAPNTTVGIQSLINSTTMLFNRIYSTFYNWTVLNNWLSFDGSTLSFNETKLGDNYYNKSEVDNIASAIAFDFFFTNHTSDITGHLNLTETHDDHSESSVTSASLSAGSHSIFNFTTEKGMPEFTEMRPGVYDARLHLFKTGTKSVIITPKLYNMSADGTKKTLLITFETSIELTTIDATYDLHGILTEEVIIPLDNRLHMEFVADVGAAGGNPTVTLDMEGTTDTHMSIETSSDAFQSIFLRQDGTTPLTSNWNFGNYSINGSGNITADYFFGNGSQLTNIPISNETQLISDNNASWFTTFNSTYDAFVDTNDSSLISEMNASWLLDTNESNQIYNLNSSWLTTFNATYDAKTNYSFGGNNFSGTGNFTTTGIGTFGEATINGQLNADGIFSATIVTGATGLVSQGDIHSTGSGDDLWLGNPIQSNALFKAFTNGTVSAVNVTIGNFHISGNTLKLVGAPNIDFDNEDLETIGIITGGKLVIDDIEINSNLITSNTGTIAFENDHLITSGRMAIGGSSVHATAELFITDTTAPDVRIESDDSGGYPKTIFGEDPNDAFSIGYNGSGSGSAGNQYQVDSFWVQPNFIIRGDGELISVSVYSDTIAGSTRPLVINSSGHIGYVSSSERYKENVKNLTNFSSIYDLNPVMYDRLDGSGDNEIGLLAEQVEQVMPDAITYLMNPIYSKEMVALENETPEYRILGYEETDIPESVNYLDLIVPLLTEVQSLNDRIKYLEDNCVMK